MSFQKGIRYRTSITGILKKYIKKTEKDPYVHSLK